MNDSTFLEIIKYFIPLIAMIALVYLFLEHWKKQESLRQRIQLNKEYKALILPTRVQAFERMILFLERISPNHLITRLNNSQFSAQEFQYILTKEINDEYEHNLSQQLYISSKTWSVISLAKDQTIQEILNAAQSLAPNATAKDLALKILNVSLQNNKNIPTKSAIEQLKADFSSLIIGK